MKKIINTILIAQLTFMTLNIYGHDCADSANIYQFSYNEKNYEIVKEMRTWEDAAACAVERGGYLVQIDDQEEHNSIYDAIINGAGVAIDYTDSPDGGMIAYVWIGANDISEEGTWIWDGDNDESGTNFWIGTGSTGNAVNDAFVNWGGISNGTPHEPDNYSNQDAAGIGLADWPESTGHLGIAGEWNDIDVSNEFYYVIEYNCSTSSSLSDSICDGDSYAFGTQTLTIEGEYIETFISASGCDSIVTLTLTVNPVYNISETHEICNSDVYTWEGNDYTTAGTYIANYTSVRGCDSIIELTLTVFQVDTSVSVNESTLTANATGTYQWIDCSDNTAITGETNKSFTASVTGNYAVEITQNSCVDTSKCYNIVITSIIENDFKTNIKVYPNPTTGLITIELLELSESYLIKLYDIPGRILLEDDLSETNKQININSYDNGIYFLTVSNAQNNYLKSFKIVKK